MIRPSRRSRLQTRRPGARRGAAAMACAVTAALAATGALAQSPPVRTSDEAGEANLQGALLAPLRDVNLMRDKVPKALNGAQDAPYLSPEDASCAQLAEMIAPLDKALGPDTGDGAETQKPGVGSMVFGALADVTRDAIPFRGVVRRITGASKQDQKVREARQAGHLRRAYLKGFASAKGCYGPVRPQVAQAEPAPSPELVKAPPVVVSALEPPPVKVAASAPQVVSSSPVFNLPDSWRAQLGGNR